MSLSPARQHRLRVQAEQAAREGGSVRHASGYDLMLLQLPDIPTTTTVQTVQLWD